MSAELSNHVTASHGSKNANARMPMPRNDRMIEAKWRGSDICSEPLQSIDSGVIPCVFSRTMSDLERNGLLFSRGDRKTNRSAWFAVLLCQRGSILRSGRPDRLVFVTGIDWAYAGSIGGEGVEDFAATCLRQRYPDAIQTKPSQGDGGIDVYRECPDGLTVWQVKKFTVPLTSSQKTQVQRSWKRFWDTHVVPGTKIIQQYYLVTPWTPTEQSLKWFREELTQDAAFPCQWDGAAFFNGLVADFPATADRFFKGADMLENMVLAKATLANSPVETADRSTMLAAINTRETALREIRDLVSDNYYVNSGTTTTADGAFPLPAAGEVGVFYQYTALGDNRFHVESLVPKNIQSTEVEPISFEMEFLVEADSPQAQQIMDWRAWGVPFTDIRARTRHVGGPFHEEEAKEAYISFVLPPDPYTYPNLQLNVKSSAGEGRRSLLLLSDEVTRGINGRGLRIVAKSPSGIFQLEIRIGSNLQPDDTQMTVLPPAGLSPTPVRDDLALLDSIDPNDEFEIVILNGPAIARGTGLQGATIAEIILPIARNLAELQTSTIDRFIMPDVTETTVNQAEQLERLTKIYNGDALTTTWDRLVLFAPEKGELDLSPLDKGHYIGIIEQPIFALGATRYQVTKRMVRSYMNPKLTVPIDVKALKPGDEIELEPNGDPTLVIAAIMDDAIDGQPPRTSE